MTSPGDYFNACVNLISVFHREIVGEKSKFIFLRKIGVKISDAY